MRALPSRGVVPLTRDARRAGAEAVALRGLLPAAPGGCPASRRRPRHRPRRRSTPMPSARSSGTGWSSSTEASSASPSEAASAQTRRQTCERTPTSGRGTCSRSSASTKHGGVPDLPVPHEAPELLLVTQASFRELLLEGAEPAKLPLAVDDLLHAARPQRPNELVLEVGGTRVEAQPLHRLSREADAEAGSLEAAANHVHLAFVTQAGELDLETARPEAREEAPDRVHAACRKNGDAVDGEVSTEARRERLERDPVALSLDEDDCRKVCGDLSALAYIRVASRRTAGARRPGGPPSTPRRRRTGASRAGCPDLRRRPRAGHPSGRPTPALG